MLGACEKAVMRRTCLVVPVILSAWTLPLPQALGQDRKIEPLMQWSGLLTEKKLTELTPAQGYIGDAAAWKKLWGAWRPTEKLPEVDFARQLVLVHLGGMYPI